MIFITYPKSNATRNFFKRVKNRFFVYFFKINNKHGDERLKIK